MIFSEAHTQSCEHWTQQARIFNFLLLIILWSEQNLKKTHLILQSICKWIKQKLTGKRNEMNRKSKDFATEKK